MTIEHNSPGRPLIRASLFAWLCAISSVSGNWMGSSSETDLTHYGNTLNRDWLYDSTSVSFQVDGCVWGYVSDNEDAGCMQDKSSDGTTYWYQMANCRRAQVAYSMYGSSSSTTSCSSSNFKESLVTMESVSTFIQYMNTYDGNSPFSGQSDLSTCEQKNGVYVGVGCAADGTFALQYFNDAYCQQPTGSTYDSLDSLNSAMSTYKGCSGIYNAGNDYSLAYYLLSISETCSSLDSGYCVDNDAMKSRRSSSSSGSHLSLAGSFAGKSWLTKLKFAVGGLLLLGSFVIFTGILFTNRRRRRALLQRKYRQSRRDGGSRKKSSRSKSKSRKGSSRSRSRVKDDSQGGVYA